MSEIAAPDEVLTIAVPMSLTHRDMDQPGWPALRQALNLPESAWRGHSDTETMLEFAAVRGVEYRLLRDPRLEWVNAVPI